VVDEVVGVVIGVDDGTADGPADGWLDGAGLCAGGSIDDVGTPVAAEESEGTPVPAVDGGAAVRSLWQ